MLLIFVQKLVRYLKDPALYSTPQVHVTNEYPINYNLPYFMGINKLSALVEDLIFSIFPFPITVDIVTNYLNIFTGSYLVFVYHIAFRHT